MTRPRLLDLFCGAGGSSAGYANAGFDVWGIDIKPQPNYPFEFIQADALDELRKYPWPDSLFDAIHASPPCQTWSAYRRRGAGVGEGYPDLIAPVRSLLRSTGLPYVLENIPASPVKPEIMLCGSSFWLDVKRHRWFESSIPIMSPPCQHGIWKPRFPPATNRTNLRRTVEIGAWRIPLPVQQAAMGINWMTLDELTQAIPPAYTEHIGRELLAALEAAA